MPVTPARLQSSMNTAYIASHVTTDDHWRAEVLWAMKVVSSHYSYVSCMETDRLFELMFPESAIAKSFSCGEKKSAYIICHGLAPYFSQQLKDHVRLLDSFVILFDESFNRFTQNKQMDIHIRFFDDGRNAVHTRYFTSAFLGHTTAANMVDVFVEKLHKLSDLHQVRDADCNAIQQQFRAFVNEVVPVNSTTFKDFNPDNERLDTFLAVYLRCTQYEKLWMVTKKLLILSHGQATVECGFSINSHMAVENVKEESLVAQRIVHDPMPCERVRQTNHKH